MRVNPGSGGSFNPLFDDRADGLATLGWIRRQAWFDGRLAMSGPSYLGYVQWAIAADADPPLAALCPHITMSNLAGHWYTVTLGAPGPGQAVRRI